MSAFVKKESALLGECYYTARHKSGLSVFVFPKKMATSYVEFVVKVGSMDNFPDEKGKKPFPDGVAHFLEHKLFDNEDGSDTFEHFAALGADSNAYTAPNRTSYLFSCAENLEKSLAELLRFVTHPYFTAESVEKERGIIAEEIRMCLDDPYERCYQNMLRGLYVKHPVRTDIAGTERSIAQITEKTLYEAYDTYSTPENMALFVCGDITAQAVMRVVEAELSDWRGKPAPVYAPLPDSPVAACALVEDVGQVGKPIFTVGIKDVAVPSDRSAVMRRCAVMDILCGMLFSKTGELYQHLRDNGYISAAFSSGYAQTRDVGCMRISGSADDPAFVLGEIQKYLAAVGEKGLSREDFERRKRVEFAEYIKSFDSTDEICGDMVSHWCEGEDIFDYAEVMQSITFEEVQLAFQNFFYPERFTLSVVKPQE